MRKVIVDKAKCIGCGSCVAIATKTFKLGEDGKVELIDPPGDEESVINEAIAVCPVGGIKFQE